MNTRSPILSAFVAMATLCGLQPAVFADGPAKTAAPFVVIVGTGEFQDKNIDARPTADADAKALYDLFADPKYLGVPPGRMKLLLSAAENRRNAQTASRVNIIEAVETAVSETGRDDLLVLAFLGRGAATADKTTFLTPDTIFKDRAKTSLMFGNDLGPAFRKLKGQKVLMLMDVQYRGFRPVDHERVAQPTLTDLEELVFDHNNPNRIGARERLLLLSGPASSAPLTLGGNSLFIRCVIGALQGAADAPPYHDGFESDSVVTSSELLKYLEAEFPKLARQNGSQDSEIRPVPHGSPRSQFAITRNPLETAKVPKRLDAVAALARNGAIDDASSREGAALMKRMPRVLPGQELRRLYQQLADGGITAEAFTSTRAKLNDRFELGRKDANTYAKALLAGIDIVTDYSIKELNAGELTAVAIVGLYRWIEEPLPNDLADLLKKSPTMTVEQRKTLLRDARSRLGQREDLDKGQDIEKSLDVMLASLNDPYTIYYDRESLPDIMCGLGRSTGVAMEARRDALRDGLLVVTPVKDGPAFKSGIRAGDLITKIIRIVDGENARKEFSTKRMPTQEALLLIRGKPGTPIELVVERDGHEITFQVERNSAPVETVMGVKRLASSEWDYLLDTKNKLGYVRLTQLHQDTARDLQMAIGGLKQQGMKGLVLDLRSNPGWYLTSGMRICELFVGKEKLMTVSPREGGQAGPPRIYSGEKDGDKSFAMVVLINGHTARMSELVAACLQDHKRATIIGERSFGKASVQDVIPFRDSGGEIMLTIARYYPPSSRNIDKPATNGNPDEEWGVKPDAGFEVKLTSAELNELEVEMHEQEIIRPSNAPVREVSENKDRQLKAALIHLRKTTEARK